MVRLIVAGVIETRVDIQPGMPLAIERHRGEEVIYVLAGPLEYLVEGGPPVTLNAGDVLFIPARAGRA